MQNIQDSVILCKRSESQDFDWQTRYVDIIERNFEEITAVPDRISMELSIYWREDCVPRASKAWREKFVDIDHG